MVEDIKNAGLDRPAGTEIFLPYHQHNERRNLVVLLRTSGDPRAVMGELRGAVQGIDPTLAVSQIRPMDEVLANAKSRPRFLATLLAAFSAAALLLAGVGLYGVIAYSVARRTPEFGIRMAIGANTPQILGLVLGHGLKLALAGIVAGALGAIALTRLMQGLLYGVSRLVRPIDARGDVSRPARNHAACVRRPRAKSDPERSDDRPALRINRGIGFSL